MDSCDAPWKTREGNGDEDYINRDEIDLHVHKEDSEMAPIILPAAVFLVLYLGLVWGTPQVLSHQLRQ